MYVGRHSSLSNYFTLEYLESSIRNAGAFGVFLFILMYTIGTLMNIPGFLFLFVGFLVYKGINGILVGYAASVIAVTIHFFFVRSMAGEALSEIKKPFIRRQMAKLTNAPIKTTVILRLIFYVSPPVNYALALSSIKWKHSLVGTMLAFPVNVMFNYSWMMFAKDWILEFL
tara:strand:+ start:161 stop:673 length:513 start_codon:yes stop_codon:yes gene_type:complete